MTHLADRILQAIGAADVLDVVARKAQGKWPTDRVLRRAWEGVGHAVALRFKRGATQTSSATGRSV